MIKKGTFKNKSLNSEEENGWEYLRASKKLQRDMASHSKTMRQDRA